MKKSEAVKELQKIILTHMNCPNDCCGNDTVVYATILSEIEDKLGMLPPYNPMGSDPLEGHTMYCQWSPEDDSSENDYISDKEYYNRYGYPDDKKEEG